MRQVLEREAHSPFYQEGVSYTLLKVTELGLVEAAEVLLEFGADLSFEGMAVGRALCLTAPWAGWKGLGGEKLPLQGRDSWDKKGGVLLALASGSHYWI